MALSNHDQAKIREYLLGRLSDAEQAQIEDRLIVEDALFDELEISKSELIDDYRAGQLKQVEQQWFEEHFLATPEGREKYTFALALDCVKRPEQAPHSTTLFQRIRDFFRVWPALTVTATAALVLAAGAWIYTGLNKPSTQFATVNLTSMNLTRGEGPQPQRVSLGNAGELRAVLELQQPAVAATTYRAELDNTNEVKPVQVLSHDTNKVVVAIPASELPAGRYALKLIAKLPDGQEQRLRGLYYFNVE
jgi:hypothetical protein